MTSETSVQKTPKGSANRPSLETKQEILMKNFASSDPKLNSHVFGNIPLKSIDFSAPETSKMFRGPKRPDGKKQVFRYQLEKLRIMIHFYTAEEFD